MSADPTPPSVLRRAVLGLGSNLGSREALIRAATDLLGASDGVRVTARSRLWETAPVGPPQPDYLNAALAVETTLAPRALLDCVLRAESTLGRVRGDRWGPRTLDVDILWIDGVAVSEDGLTVPHPRLRERAFALGPLLEVCPDARDPVTGTLLATEVAEVRALGGQARRVRDFPEAFEAVEMEHTADEGVIVRAGDRADLLAAAAEALGALVAAPAGVSPATVSEVRVAAPGDDWPDDERTHAWLSEVLYHLDARRLAVRRAVVLADDPQGVRGLLLGEALDEDRHAVRGALKAVTWHALEVGLDGDGLWRAQFVVDV